MEISEYCEKFWKWRLNNAPEFASLVGIHEYDSYLESYKITDIEGKIAYCKELLADISTFVKLEKITPDDDLNLELLKTELLGFINGAEFCSYFYPVNFLEGIQVDFEQVIGWMKFVDEDDYKMLLDRFKALPQQANEIFDLLSEAVKRGYTNCQWSMNGVVEQFDRIVKVDDITKLPFFQPFADLKTCDSISESTKVQLMKEGELALIKHVVPNFQRLRDFIAQQYLPNLRADISINSIPLPGDKASRYYEACLKFHITCDITPDQVHQIGLDEVARIRKSMEKVMKDVGFKGTLHEFFDHLRTSPQFYYKTKEELLDGYRELVFKIIRPKLPALFKTMPQMELVIKARPPGLGGGPLAYYIAGSNDGSRPGTFYVNTSDVNISPKYEMMSLALHEGEPGHHLQSSLAIETRGLPEFRRYLEDRKYSDAPARFGMNTAYIEGWGLYSEALGEELGLYTDPYSLFGRYSNEIYRATRLVVDTGMHQFGWSRDRAIQFMRDNVGTSLQNIENEINRYITWPGQACAYKIGEIKLRELRKYASKELGDRFDIRDFHDEILQHSAVPLLVLERLVKKYVSNQVAQ